MGDYKISDIFQESANHPVLKDLAALDRLLASNASSNIGMSNQDMLKAYIETYSRCLQQIQAQRNSFGNLNELSFYTKCILRNTRSVEIVMAYQRNLATMIQWCEQQRGTAGRPMPLTQRMRLPSFTDGLSALGIQEE